MKPKTKEIVWAKLPLSVKEYAENARNTYELRCTLKRAVEHCVGDVVDKITDFKMEGQTITCNAICFDTKIIHQVELNFEINIVGIHDDDMEYTLRPQVNSRVVKKKKIKF